MRHIFVVNPCAGGVDSSKLLTESLNGLSYNTELYITHAPHDATRFVAEQLQATDGEDLRFYACGGDGTLNEVVEGVLKGMQGAKSGERSVEVACYPCGSGNDYVKCWPEYDFSDLEALMAGQAVKVDVMRVNDFCCINVMNFGFEAEVCRTMQNVRRWPLVGGQVAYTTGIVHSLLKKRRTEIVITVDGQPFVAGQMLLGSAASGRFVGGGYLCAPRAVPDDGQLEILAIDSIGIPRFASLIGLYREGKHLDDPRTRDIVHITSGQRVLFEGPKDFSIVVDGEVHRGRHFEVKCLPGAMNFVLPNMSDNK